VYRLILSGGSRGKQVNLNMLLSDSISTSQGMNFSKQNEEQRVQDVLRINSSYEIYTTSTHSISSTVINSSPRSNAIMNVVPSLLSYLLIGDRGKLISHSLNQILILYLVSGNQIEKRLEGTTFFVITSSPSLGTSNFMLRSCDWSSPVASRTLFQLAP
jgi:hypothetical protein